MATPTDNVQFILSARCNLVLCHFKCSSSKKVRWMFLSFFSCKKCDSNNIVLLCHYCYRSCGVDFPILIEIKYTKINKYITIYRYSYCYCLCEPLLSLYLLRQWKEFQIKYSRKTVYTFLNKTRLWSFISELISVSERIICVNHSLKG